MNDTFYTIIKKKTTKCLVATVITGGVEGRILKKEAKKKINPAGIWAYFQV